jgi:UDP-glucose 4-epimerase
MITHLARNRFPGTIEPIMHTKPAQHSAQGAGTALVTGGAGFLGSHVAEGLLAAGLDVVVLDDLSGGYQENVPSRARLIVGSILDRDLLARIFEEREFDYVFHFAAYAAECLSHHIRNFNYLHNVVGTSNLITETAKKRIKAFVFASSAAVYGTTDASVSEDTVPQPEDPYGIAKYAMELDLRAAHRVFGLPYVIFRLHNVYGERQDLTDRYRNVVAIHMRQALLGQPMTVFGAGDQTRQFTYVGDVIPHITRSIHLEAAIGQTFNIGGSTTHSVLEIAEMVSESLGVACTVHHEPPRIETHDIHIDHSRAQRVFGPMIETPTQLGLARMATWARENVRLARPFRTVEIDDHLPPAWRAGQSVQP